MPQFLTQIILKAYNIFRYFCKKNPAISNNYEATLKAIPSGIDMYAKLKLCHKAK